MKECEKITYYKFYVIEKDLLLDKIGKVFFPFSLTGSGIPLDWWGKEQQRKV